MVAFDNLPIDVVNYLADFLPDQDACKMRVVNKKCKEGIDRNINFRNKNDLRIKVNEKYQEYKKAKTEFDKLQKQIDLKEKKLGALRVNGCLGWIVRLIKKIVSCIFPCKKSPRYMEIYLRDDIRLYRNAQHQQKKIIDEYKLAKQNLLGENQGPAGNY